MAVPKTPKPMYKVRNVQKRHSYVNIQTIFPPYTTQTKENPIDNVRKYLKNLVDEKKCSDEYFISPVVITVKYDKSIKIAQDSKKINDGRQKK